MSPSRPLGLLLYDGPEVHATIELIGLSTRVADEALVVETLGVVHDPLTVHAKVSAPHLLHFNGCEGQRLPFTGGLCLNLGDFRELGHETLLKQDCSNHSVE